MNTFRKRFCSLLAFLLFFYICPPLCSAAANNIPVKNVIVTSSHASYPGSNAVDGVTTSRWQHLSSDIKPAITFDLGRKTAFNELFVMPTGATAVKSYIIEAADNANMTQNRIVLSSGNKIDDVNVFAFKTVSRRYLRYTVSEKSGFVGLFEFQIYHSSPSEVRFADVINDTAIPSAGEESRRISLPEAEVLDKSGDAINQANYKLEYSVSAEKGVYIDYADETLVITDEAEPGSVTLTAGVKNAGNLACEMAFDLFKKKNLAENLPVSDDTGMEISEITDGDYSTCYSAENNAILIADFKEPVDINKIKLIFSGSLSSLKITGVKDSEEVILAEMLSPSEGNVTECFSRDAFRFIKIYAEGAGTIKFFEFEAYNVSPLKIISAFDRYESYVPGFDEPAAEVMPPEIHVIDIYGDDVPKDLSRVIWSVSGGVPQGIELDSETGTLTVDPMASPGKLKLIARLSDNEDISAEFTVLLSETEIVSVPDYISYRKNVEAAPNHGSYPPSNAVDGNLTTRLQFLWSVEHPYITVDLGDSMEFNSITLHLMSGSMVKEATVRASDSKEELFDEKSIIGRMTGPLGSKTKVGLPFTTARYVTVYFDRTDPGVSILEFEVRKSDPAIIYAEGYPEKIAVSKLETVFSETPRVDVRDVDGASLVIDDGAYSFEAVSMPGGVEIDSKTGVVSVAPEAEAGEAVIRVYYINDRTIYNEYVIKITDGEDADEADSAAIIAAAIASFDIADYTDPYNTVSDFTLPVNLENGVTVLWSVNGAQGCLKTDETGFVKVTRSDKNTEVTLTGKFTCGGSFSEVYYQINVPGIKRVNAGGGSSGGGGSGGGGVLSGYTGSAANVPDNTENKYSDIDEVSWAAEYLTELADKKIMEGYDGKLYPSAEITREEFVKIIIKGFFPDSEMTANSIFIDIPNDSWCAGYVSAAVNLGLIRGISSDLFGQGAALTRQDAVVILERVVQKLNVRMPAVKTVEFADKADIADYARGAADTFSKAGIVSGDDNSKFLPGKTITRAEAAKMLCLTLREVENEI